MFGVFFGPFNLFGVMACKIGFGLLPFFLKAAPKKISLQHVPLFFGNAFKAVVVGIEVVEFCSPEGKHGPPFEHLDLNAHFKHIRCRGHGHISLAGVRQHMADGFGCAGFHAGLIDGTRENIGRAHGKCRCGGVGGGDSTAESHTGRIFVLVLFGQFIAQGDHGR